MEFEEIFKKANENAYIKFINNDKFKEASRVHDWRNHVPDEFIKIWMQLTERERKIIFILAEKAASEEDWD